jgi:hypothetical protein
VGTFGFMAPEQFQGRAMPQCDGHQHAHRKDARRPPPPRTRHRRSQSLP